MPRFEDEHEDTDVFVPRGTRFGPWWPAMRGVVVPGTLAPDVDHMSYEERLSFFHDVEVGLSQDAVGRFPLTPFHKTESNEGNCTVCLCDYDEGETVMTLPCLHQFHPDCIRGWLKGHTTCPICRVDLKNIQD